MMTGFLSEKQFSRKNFVKGGGALIISFSALGEMYWISGVGADCTLVTFDYAGNMQLTSLFYQLVSAAKAIQATKEIRVA